MGGHGHGHEPPYTVPDYKIYKVENVPKLVKLQEKLATLGLKDPWARNYVWRFHPPKEYRKKIINHVLRGYKLGIPAFLLTIAAEKYFGIDYGHGHHDDHGDGHH